MRERFAPPSEEERRNSVATKKASKGHTKGKTLKPGKSIEKKLPLDNPSGNIGFNFGGVKQ
jgi:hypothetical protein